MDLFIIDNGKGKCYHSVKLTKGEENTMKSHSPYVKKYQQKHDAFKIRPTLEEGEKIRNYATATNNSVQGLFLLSVREYMILHPAPEAETEAEGKKGKGS